MSARDISRRDFAGAAAALALLHPVARAQAATGGAAPATPAAIPAAIRAMYRRATVIDALASLKTWNVPYPPPGPLSAEQLRAARASGITAINVTVGSTALDQTVKEIGYWLGEIARHPDQLMQVKHHRDIATAKATGRIGLIFGFQGMQMIGQDLAMIDAFAAMDVKIMQLTYNDRNAIGAGSSLPESEGLTAFGRQAIERLNTLGVLVDVGHANATTALDAARASQAPITASHTGARAIHDSQRNLPDTVFRAIAERGGVVGLYLMPFLGKGPPAVSAAQFMRHLTHALDVCGEDHVGIGSDQSITPVLIDDRYMAIVRQTAAARAKAGIGAPGEADIPVTVPELNSEHRLEMIAGMLARAGYPASVARKVVGANFDRLFATVWKA